MTASHLKPNDWCFSVIWPRDVVAEVDRVRGHYISRNKYLLKLVEEHLEQKHVLMGQKVPIQGPTAATAENSGGSQVND